MQAFTSATSVPGGNDQRERTPPLGVLDRGTQDIDVGLAEKTEETQRVDSVETLQTI